MDKDTQLRGYRFAVYPTPDQKRELLRIGAMAKDLYNATVQRFEDYHWRDKYDRWQHNRLCSIEGRKDFRAPYPRLQGKNSVLYGELAELRRELPEWQDLNIFVATGIIETVEKAFDAYRRRRKDLTSQPALLKKERQRFFDRRGRWPTLERLAGYPRRKRWDDPISIPMGNVAAFGGWNLVRSAAARRDADSKNSIGCRGANNTLGSRGLSYVFTFPYGMRDGKRRKPRQLHARGAFPYNDEPDQKSIRAGTLSYDGDRDRWELAAVVHAADADKWDGWRKTLAARGRKRRAGNVVGASIPVRFDGIDALAYVSGAAETPSELREVSLLQDETDQRKSKRDFDWLMRHPMTTAKTSELQRALSDANDPERREQIQDALRELLGRTVRDLRWEMETREIARLSQHVAAKRTNALHVWTTSIVRRATGIEVTIPSLKEAVRSPRGHKSDWGALVETVSKLNKSLLSNAMRQAATMLEYKAQQAGIPCSVEVDEAPEVLVGEKLVAAGKAVRKSKRALENYPQ